MGHFVQVGPSLFNKGGSKAGLMIEMSCQCYRVTRVQLMVNKMKQKILLFLDDQNK